MRNEAVVRCTSKETNLGLGQIAPQDGKLPFAALQYFSNNVLLKSYKRVH